MYLRNAWYVAAWSSELADKPLARVILDKEVVLYRADDGAGSTLEDRCPHRYLPLSKGTIEGSTLRCGYHGMAFDGAGTCVRIPSQAAIPSPARVRSYPTVERWGWIWAWMGDEAKADDTLLPDFSMLTNAEFAVVGTTKHVRASYQLLVDNLMDLSHVGIVHQSTIGNSAMTENGRLTSRRTERGAKVLRLVPDVPPPPTYIRSGELSEGVNIDRWQSIEFIAPSSVLIHVGGAPAGTGALDGNYEHGLNLWVLNAITRETERSCHYFWASARKHALGDKMADALFYSQTFEAFEEDARILEAQQRVLDKRGDAWTLALKSDAGGIEARRVVSALVAQERSASAALEAANPR